MKNSAKTVAACLKTVPEERRECLKRIRALCLASLPGYREGIAYGMPSYQRNGVVEIAFASQANYISVYVLKTDVVAANRAALKGLSVGKGCIRYPGPGKIDWLVLEKLLTDTFRSSKSIC